MDKSSATTTLPESARTFEECAGCDRMPTDEEIKEAVDRIISAIPPAEGSLIPTLQSTQNYFGYLPKTGLKEISRRLKIPYSQVSGVVSFYSFFSTVPRGKHLIRVCLGTSCYVRGGKDVLTGFKETLGIGVGETTEDRLFSLEVGRCFGACGLAPVVIIDDDTHQRVKPTRISEIIDFYKRMEKGEE